LLPRHPFGPDGGYPRVFLPEIAFSGSSVRRRVAKHKHGCLALFSPRPTPHQRAFKEERSPKSRPTSGGHRTSKSQEVTGGDRRSKSRAKIQGERRSKSCQIEGGSHTQDLCVRTCVSENVKDMCVRGGQRDAQRDHWPSLREKESKSESENESESERARVGQGGGKWIDNAVSGSTTLQVDRHRK